jgi:hypothetical protein
MLDGGANPSVVQKQMRHSDPRVTLGIYGHVKGDAQRRAIESHAERIEAGKMGIQLEPIRLIRAGSSISGTVAIKLVEAVGIVLVSRIETT